MENNDKPSVPATETSTAPLRLTKEELLQTKVLYLQHQNIQLQEARLLEQQRAIGSELQRIAMIKVAAIQAIEKNGLDLGAKYKVDTTKVFITEEGAIVDQIPAGMSSVIPAGK